MKLEDVNIAKLRCCAFAMVQQAVWSCIIATTSALLMPAASAGSRCDSGDYGHPEITIQNCTPVINGGQATYRDYLVRGRAYGTINKYDLALADFNACIRTAPARYHCLDDHAWANLRLGKYDEAIVDYREIVSRPVHTLDNNNKLADAYEGRAAAYEKNGQFKLAIDDYNAALKVISDTWHRGDDKIEAAKARATRALQAAKP